MTLLLLYGIAELVVRRMLGMESQESYSDVPSSPWRSWVHRQGLLWHLGNHVLRFQEPFGSLTCAGLQQEHPMFSGLGIQKNTKEIKILVLDNWGICSFIEREDQQVSVIAIIYWVLPLWLCHSTDRCFLCIVTVILTATLWARFCDYSHFHMRKLKLKIWIETQSYTHRLVWLKSLCSVLSPASKVDI